MTRKIAIYAVAAVLLMLLVARFVNLNEDPPLYNVNHGQSQLTDPYNVTLPARNRVLFGTWNLFGIHRWDVFRNSLMSAAAYVAFEAAGVSRVSANVASLLLQLAGLGLFLLGLRAGGLRGWGLVITALLLLVNGQLFFYGRAPFLENGLIFLSGLLFWVFVRFHDRLWGQALIGVLLALAGLAGKLFGLLLLGPILIALVYRLRSKVLVPLIVTIAGAVVSGVLYLEIFFGGRIGTLMSYYHEQSVGMYGKPPGFMSISTFFKMLIIYGGESGLWQFLPLFVVLVAVCLLLLVLSHRFDREYRPEHVSLLFCLVWLLGGILALSPFYYRPLRYALFLMLPAAALGGYTIALVLGKKIKMQLGNRWITIPLVFIIAWYLFTQIGILLGHNPQRFVDGLHSMPLAALLAAIVTAVVYLLLFRRPRFLPLKAGRVGVFFLVILVVVIQGTYLERGLFRPGHYLQDYNSEVAAIVDPSAVITGPFGPALTIDNKLKAVIYMFGLSNVETDLFQKYPISHIITDRANWQVAVKDFPELKNALLEAEMIVRDEMIVMYRLPHAKVPMTDFERGAEAFSNRQPDSAAVYFGRFLKSHPNSLIARTHYITALYLAGKRDVSYAAVDSLIADHPDNYMLQGFCRGFYRLAYRVTKDPRFQTLADKYKRSALKLNPALSRLQ